MVLKRCILYYSYKVKKLFFAEQPGKPVQLGLQVQLQLCRGIQHRTVADDCAGACSNCRQLQPMEHGPGLRQHHLQDDQPEDQDGLKTLPSMTPFIHPLGSR